MIESADLFYGLIAFAAAALIVIGVFLIFSDVVRKNPWTIVLIAAVIAWIIAESMAFIDRGPGHIDRWNTVKYAAISFIGPAWFGVATRFSAKSWWVGIKGSALLIASGALFAIAVIAEPLHGLLDVAPPEEGGGHLLRSGPLWHLLMAFLFACLIGGLIVVRREVTRFPPIMKRRGAVLIIAVALPAIFALLDLLPIPLPAKFPQAPLSLIFSSFALFYGFIRLRLASPIRLARETVIDMMTDPVVVIDESMRIAMANSAARLLSKETMPARAGIRLSDAFPGLEALARAEDKAKEASWTFGGKDYLVRLTYIEDPRTLSRAVIATLSDVTELIDQRERLESVVEERTAQLKRTNEELMKSVAMHEEAERRLREALAEKELLMKEIHHRVKNNLQIVTSLINLHSGGISDPEARSVYSNLKNCIKSITLVHERIYSSSSLTKVELGQYVKELSALIAASIEGRDITVSVEVPAATFMVDPDCCVDIGLLLNELIANSVKHGQSASGASALSVRMELTDDYIGFAFHDNGRGFSSEIPERSGSLGMRIIRSIAKKYDAQVKFENEGGALVTVAIPAARIRA